MKKSIIPIIILILMVVCVWSFQKINHQKEAYEVLTSDGVVHKIQSLNRLQTVGYHIDTVIQSHKEGSWYRLWQDEQKGLFVAHGRVLAGVDLHKLNLNHVQITQHEQGQQIKIILPAAEVFETYLDKIEVYDIKTGLFNILDMDPEMFNQAQTEAKRQVLSSACKTEMLTLAAENAQKQIKTLFELVDVHVDVEITQATHCA